MVFARVFVSAGNEEFSNSSCIGKQYTYRTNSKTVIADKLLKTTNEATVQSRITTHVYTNTMNKENVYI